MHLYIPHTNTRRSKATVVGTLAETVGGMPPPPPPRFPAPPAPLPGLLSNNDAVMTMMRLPASPQANSSSSTTIRVCVCERVSVWGCFDCVNVSQSEYASVRVCECVLILCVSVRLCECVLIVVCQSYTYMNTHMYTHTQTHTPHTNTHANTDPLHHTHTHVIYIYICVCVLIVCLSVL